MTSAGEPPPRSDDDHDTRQTTDNADQLSRQSAGWRSRLIATAGSVWREMAFLCRRRMIWWFRYDFFISYCHESERYCQALAIVRHSMSRCLTILAASEIAHRKEFWQGNNWEVRVQPLFVTHIFVHKWAILFAEQDTVMKPCWTEPTKVDITL